MTLTQQNQSDFKARMKYSVKLEEIEKQGKPLIVWRILQLLFSNRCPQMDVIS